MTRRENKWQDHHDPVGHIHLIIEQSLWISLRIPRYPALAILHTYNTIKLTLHLAEMRYTSLFPLRLRRASIRHHRRRCELIRPGCTHSRHECNWSSELRTLHTCNCVSCRWLPVICELSLRKWAISRRSSLRFMFSSNPLGTNRSKPNSLLKVDTKTDFPHKFGNSSYTN